MTLSPQASDNKTHSITHSTNLSFLDFVDLFKSFSLRCRKDLRDLYDQLLLNLSTHEYHSHLPPSTLPINAIDKQMGLITRNSSLDYNQDMQKRRKICDAISVASIVSNCTGVDTSHSQYLSVGEISDFLSLYQNQDVSNNDIVALIQRHEQDPLLRDRDVLSFEGFTRYLMDKDNYAFVSDKSCSGEDMDHPLSHYYVASSHNTYLSGHQLKGESSVDLYTQVLKSGCRCVELDCWDGDDGLPIVYHGHTLTTKISFKAVIEAIDISAFLTSPYPVILSVENHCSIPQQQKMAQIFLSTFGEKLVTSFLFDSDFSDDPQLPSPNQLKYKILIKNKKLRQPNNTSVFRKLAMSYSRANSMISSENLTSSTCLNDDDDDDDDDEDDEDMVEVKDMGRRSLELQEQGMLDTESKSSYTSRSGVDSFDEHHSRFQLDIIQDKSRPGIQPGLDWQFEDDYDVKTHAKTKSKKAAQITKELSDLVIYTQAVKFRGLCVSPVTMKQKKAYARKNILGSSSSTPNVIAAAQKSDLSIMHQRMKKNDDSPSCYHVSSINENKAKQLCRRNPTAMISHTERQLMRTYPAGMRIDSSNFNPVIFWAFGLQMVALNYQTEDAAMAINTALFEQTASCGYVLKPRLMWDKSHVMYNRFNPWDKEFDGLFPTNVTLAVISGQYVSTNLASSVQVEVEIIGIPVDCIKYKTKVCTRNALNPIWNEVYTFQVMLLDLVFVRFIVMDTNSNHMVAHRVLPLRLIRPGYRHVRLLGTTNHILDLSTLFIFSKVEDGEIDHCGMPDLLMDNPSRYRASALRPRDITDKMDIRDSCSPMLPLKHKRRLFFVSVFGLTSPDEYVILKVTQDTTVHEAITQALVKAGYSDQNTEDFMLIEDVHSSWAKQDQEKGGQQRMLDIGEKVLQAQNRWKGNGKFILRKKVDDPSSRAWMSSIMSKESKGGEEDDWGSDENMFLVCVYNVSPDQPYTIFRAPITSLAIDIITQAMVRARRAEDPRNFVLVEEIELPSSDTQTLVNRRQGGLVTERHILADDENVHRAQSVWKTRGKFVMVDRELLEMDMEPLKQKKLAGKIYRMGSRLGYRKQLTKSMSARESSYSSSNEYLSTAPPSPSYSLTAMAPSTTDKSVTSRIKRLSSRLHLKLMK